MDYTDFLVIGGGVVGLAVTADLATRYGDSAIILMEKHAKFGQETSSRNSEVIHSGIYYPTGSLKARLCVEGKRMLYDFCSKRGVPHKNIGKLIVAKNHNELETLNSLLNKGRENGVDDLEELDEHQVNKLEPNVKAVGAVLSPSTGIIDSHRLMARLEEMARQGGAMLAYGYEVIDINRTNDGYIVTYSAKDGSTDKMATRCLINCAGLSSDKIACMLGIDIEKEGYKLYPCKGEYFSINSAKAHMVSRLIYPTPLAELKGLGIHVTKSLDGNIRLGPNAYYVDALDYKVDPANKDDFYNSAAENLPFIEYDDVTPDMSGIRPKLQGPGHSFRDFIIRHEADKGLTGVINLIGIESPGLTSSLSIAKMVGEIIKTEIAW